MDKYTYRVFYSDEDQAYVGTCLEFPGLSALAKSDAGALKEIKFVVSQAVEMMLDDGETPPEPLNTTKYSGKFVVRVGADLHRRLAMEARESGLSLNQHILKKLASG